MIYTGVTYDESLLSRAPHVADVAARARRRPVGDREGALRPQRSLETRICPVLGGLADVLAIRRFGGDDR